MYAVPRLDCSAPCSLIELIGLVYGLGSGFRVQGSGFKI